MQPDNLKAYEVTWHKAPNVRQYIAARSRAAATSRAWQSVLDAYGHAVADWNFRTVRAPAYDAVAASETRHGSRAVAIGWYDGDTREACGCCEDDRYAA
jgi:hypothetical protein